MKGEKNKKGAATKYQKPSVNNTLPKLVRCYKNDDFAGFKKAYLPLQKTIKLETLRLSKKGELVIVNACLHGKLNFIQFFCQAGQVYLGGHGGAKNNSLAHYAVIGDQPEVLRLLLNLDPILLDNKDGESPLDLAMQNFKVGCIGVIIDFHYLLFRSKLPYANPGTQYCSKERQFPLYLGYDALFNRIFIQADEIIKLYKARSTTCFTQIHLDDLRHRVEGVLVKKLFGASVGTFCQFDWGDMKEEIIEAMYEESSRIGGKLLSNISEVIFRNIQKIEHFPALAAR